MSKVKEHLLSTSEWRRHSGSDHVLILGRPVQDFLRDKNGFSLDDPFWARTIKLSVEATAQAQAIAVPWPGVLRPASRDAVDAWKRYALAQRRTVLLTFVGNTRRSYLDGGQQARFAFARGCNASSQCIFNNALPPGKLWALYLRSKFCIHLAGDTFTRRGLFDSSVCGCVPVVADIRTADYPVLRPQFGGRNFFRRLGLVVPTFESALRRAASMPASELNRRRQALINLSPKLVYNQHGGGDAFEWTMANARAWQPRFA